MLPFIPLIAAALATSADEAEGGEPIVPVRGNVCEWTHYKSVEILQVDVSGKQVQISVDDPNEGNFKQWVGWGVIRDCRPPARAPAEMWRAPKPPAVVWHKLNCGHWTSTELFGKRETHARCPTCRTFKEVVPTTEKGPESWRGPVGTCPCKTCAGTLRNQ
jgi:hypothetical protein